MTDDMIRAQSNAAYGQWAKQWREHAIQHSAYPKKSFDDYEASGVGRAILCVANGYSFEENIETIKKYQHNVDILCCDKTLGHLLDHGITPKYCMVCDANVDFEKYMAKWKDQLNNTTLFMNACGNPEWTAKGNWKEVCLFVNKDIIHSEIEFCKLSGTGNLLPAGTNVSNAMLILLTQSDNEGRKNFFGYDKIILIGFDYSWKAEGKYYAFDEDGNGKRNYMKHSYLVSPNGAFCYTSGNLAFSRDWILKYVTTFNLPVVQCAPDSLLSFGKSHSLETQMQYSHAPEDRKVVIRTLKELRATRNKLAELENTIGRIGKDHWMANAASL